MENRKEMKNEENVLTNMRNEDQANVNQVNKSFLADPAPLGLAAFGFTTFLLSFVNAGLLSSAAVSVVMPLAFAYGGFAQLLTGAFEMRRGNTFGFTAFTSYGSFWFFYGFLVLFASMKIITIPSTALGVALILWGLFTLYMWVNAMKLNMALKPYIFIPVAGILYTGIWSILLINRPDKNRWRLRIPGSVLCGLHKLCNNKQFH